MEPFSLLSGFGSAFGGAFGGGGGPATATQGDVIFNGSSAKAQQTRLWVIGGIAAGVLLLVALWLFKRK